MKYLCACGIFLLLFSASCKNNSADAKAKYQCPMQCEGEKSYDTAGKCPVCGMDMQKVKQ